MFCPVCHSEYRPGFTVCSDCHVDLVEELTAGAQGDAALSGDESFVLVWSGTDPRRHAEVRETLDREHIVERTMHREDHFINATQHAPFEVYVPADLAAKAQAILNQSIPVGEEEEEAIDVGGLEIPAEDYQAAEGATWERRSDWDPDEATVNIWAGEDSDLAGMVTASLRENQIRYRTNADDLTMDELSEAEHAAIDDAETRIYVVPEDEAHAREIVREIVDGAPPDFEPQEGE